MSQTWICSCGTCFIAARRSEQVEDGIAVEVEKRRADSGATLSTPITSTTRNGALLYQTAIVDLTERKRFEEKLQRSEERYRTLFDLVPVAVYVCDADGIIQEYNRRAAELWGREPGQNGEKPRFCGSYKIYYPDGRYMPHEECPMARVLRGEKLKPKIWKLSSNVRTAKGGTSFRRHEFLQTVTAKSSVQSIPFLTSPSASVQRRRHAPGGGSSILPRRGRGKGFEWNHYRLEPKRRTHFWIQTERDNRQIDSHLNPAGASL